MRDEVDDDLINFNEILNQVRVRNFEYKLPPSIRKVIENDTSPQEKSPPHKKGKTNNDDQNTRVTNDGTIAAWMPDQDTYANAIRNSDSLKKRPTINDTIMCHRFHSKGYCFNNCNNKQTHVPSSSLDQKTKKEYLNWLEKATK